MSLTFKNQRVVLVFHWCIPFPISLLETIHWNACMASPHLLVSIKSYIRSVFSHFQQFELIQKQKFMARTSTWKIVVFIRKLHLFPSCLFSVCQILLNQNKESKACNNRICLPKKEVTTGINLLKCWRRKQNVNKATHVTEQSSMTVKNCKNLSMLRLERLQYIIYGPLRSCQNRQNQPHTTNKTVR